MHMFLTLTELTDVSRLEIVQTIGRSAVALFGIDRPDRDEVLAYAGSGTLVRAVDTDFILTAAHVWREKLQYCEYVALTVRENEDHRFAIRTDTIEAKSLLEPPKGQDGKYQWGSAGPDIAYLRIPPDRAGALRAIGKVFYDLSARQDSYLSGEVDATQGVWVMMGAAAAGGTFSPVHATLAFPGYFTAVPHIEVEAPVDYLDVGAYQSSPFTPQSFGGVSGGGLWQVRATAEQVSAGAIPQKALSLEGVVFFQSPVEGGVRWVRSHGRRTIFHAMPH